MKVQLVSVPWQALDYPSLALGILRTITESRGHESQTYLGNLKFAELLDAESILDVPGYLEVAENGFYLGLGDWIFSAALHGTETWQVDNFRPLVSNQKISLALEELQRAASRFIEDFAHDLVEVQADLLCVTSTFSENVAALALAKRVKELDAGRLIAIGGGNCDGVQGQALHRNYDCLDFVVRGEGEEAYPELLEAISRGEGFEKIAGLSWRKIGKRVDNPPRMGATPTADLVTPNYDSYFEQVESSDLSSKIDPRLVMETSRGCWWGEKHQCTFCGLNGSLMIYRGRPHDRIFDELKYLVQRYQILDVIIVDNILDMAMFTTFLPSVKALEWDLRMHYEVKSNLKPEQLRDLVSAGVINVQPGIESLSTRVLGLMKKGVTGPLNVRFLRAGEEAGTDISWNYLYGFPGETDADYESVIRQVPRLYHLTPPDGSARLAIERFSPYFDQPELGFANKQPAMSYGLIYGLPEEELSDIAFLFDSDIAGISGDIERALSKALEEWKIAYRSSSLVFYDYGEYSLIHDKRQAREIEYSLNAEETLAYKILMSPRSIDGLQRNLELSAGEVDRVVTTFEDAGLVFSDGGQMIALATRPIPRRVKL